jgi:HSP20 family molecular chaperone IbpA
MQTTLYSLSNLLKEIKYTSVPLEQGSRIPRYNVRIDGDTAVYRLALPGYRKSDIQVRCTDNQLTVSSQAQESYDSKDIVTSFRVSPFSISWIIRGSTVSKATMSDGVLEIVMRRNVSETGDLVSID